MAVSECRPANERHEQNAEAPKRKRGRRRALLMAGVCVGAVLVAVLLAELWVRRQTFGGLGPWRIGGTVRQGVEDEYCEWDPLLGWRGKAGFEGVHYRANLPATPLRLNSRGWRDVEPSAARTPGKRRIVLLGDSFGMGLGVAREEGVATLLGNELGAEVVNLAMNGYSTDQELLVLEREGLAYSPDIVVVLFYWNDLYQNAFPVTFLGYIKPCFTLDRKGKLVLQYEPGPHDRPTPGVLRGLGRTLRGHSELFRRIWVQRRMAAVRAGKAPPVSPFDYPGPKPRKINLSPDPKGTDRKAVVILGKLLRRIDALSRSRGARTLVVVIPLWFQVRQLAQAADPVDYGRIWPDAIMLGFERRTRIPTLLLLPHLRETERAEPTSFPREFHWTPAGHRTAAKAIAGEIRRRGWLGMDRTPR